MASRNRTLVFIQKRSERKSHFRSRESQLTSSKQGLLSEEDGYDMDQLEKGKKTNLSLPPGWLSLVDDVNYDISRIKTKMKELLKSHSNHLKPSFDEAFDEEQTIEILTEDITRLFQQGQLKVSRLGKQSVSDQEASLQKNLVSSLASQLQELSVQFRKDQKDYLQRLRARQQKGKSLFQIEEDVMEDDANFEVSFTMDQKQSVTTSEDAIIQRETEIKQIAKSINELSSIFKDLATMVIEQGTILDRIDYNIEAVAVNTSRSVVELTSAQRSQKKARTKMCMLLLCIMILIMVVVVLMKGMIG